MPVTLLRVLIMYLLIAVIMRFMGKRQIGELQMSEFVITILLSEIAAIPIQSTDAPILNAVASVIILAAFEVLSSALSIKSRRFQKFAQGHSLIVVRDGQIDLPQLRRLRFSVDDLLEALRDKDVFDISEVQYARLETNGRVTVMLKPEYRPATAQMLNAVPEDSGIQCTVVYDGKIVRDEFPDCGMTDVRLKKLLEQKKIRLCDIMLMTVDRAENCNILMKQ